MQVVDNTNHEFSHAGQVTTANTVWAIHQEDNVSEHYSWLHCGYLQHQGKAQELINCFLQL